MPKLERCSEGSYIFWCPGCEEHHAYGPGWAFNGDLERPTFTPSLLVNHLDCEGKRTGRVCHLYLTDGVLRFLGDCSHALRGQNVPLPECGGR